MVSRSYSLRLAVEQQGWGQVTDCYCNSCQSVTGFASGWVQLAVDLFCGWLRLAVMAKRELTIEKPVSQVTQGALRVSFQNRTCGRMGSHVSLTASRELPEMKILNPIQFIIGGFYPYFRIPPVAYINIGLSSWFTPLTSHVKVHSTAHLNSNICIYIYIYL